MPNTISYASILADVRIQAQLAMQYELLLASRDAFPFYSLLTYAGDVAGGGSDSKKFPLVDLDGGVLPAPYGDGVSAVLSPLTDTSVTFTVQRFSKGYSITDLAKFTDPFGMFSAERFAQDAVISHEQRRVDLIANLLPGFSQNVNLSGAPLTAVGFLQAIGTLEVNDVQGPYNAMLHARQLDHLRRNLASVVAGQLQWPNSINSDSIWAIGTGFKGAFAGANIFVSNRVTLSGTDRVGGMFGRNAIGYVDMTVQAEDPTSQFVLGGKVRLDWEMEAAAAKSSLYSHSWSGFAELIDLAGVRITSQNAA